MLDSVLSTIFIGYVGDGFGIRHKYIYYLRRNKQVSTPNHTIPSKELIFWQLSRPERTLAHIAGRL